MRRRTNKRSRKINKKKNIIIINSIIIIMSVALFSVIFSILNMGNSKIILGIKIEGIDVSNLSQEEVTKKINDWKQELLNSEINLSYEDLEESISAQEIIDKIEVQSAIQEACETGKIGNIIQNNYEILFTMLFGKNISINLDVNEENINKQIEEIDGKLPGAMIENNYYVEESNLIIKAGQEGIITQKEELKKRIEEELKKQDKQTIKIPIQTVNPNEIDIDEIHTEIYKKPEDAYIKENPVEIHPHVNGVDFAITIAEAKDIVKEKKEEYIIPLKITVPEKTIDSLAGEAFPINLGEFVTRYDVKDQNRSENLAIASKKIDGTIILPGETFSYNKAVGERTISEGYKEAGQYIGGKLVNGIGGGICQLSSTLYNAVLYANLEIVARTNHGYLCAYINAGRDATVSWGTIDFQFKNTRKYPVKIKSTVRNGVVEVAIYGIPEEKEYEVVIEDEIIETIPNTTTYIDDNTLEKGTEITEQQGFEGAKSITYKILKYNGVVESKTLLSNDTYKPMETVIRRGTK